MKRLLLGVLLLSASGHAEPGDTKEDTPAAAEAPPPDVSKMRFGPEAISQIVKFHHPRVIACYEEFLANRENPPEGIMLTWFVINADGVVSKAKIRKKGSTVYDEGLNACVLEVISSMVFPKPPDGEDNPVEFPFRLQAVR